jgi:hypothetical protein
MLKIYRINYAFLQWDVGIMSYKITKKLEAITKTLFTFIRGLGIVFITIMIDAIINPSYWIGFVAITLGVIGMTPILSSVFYALISSYLSQLTTKDKNEWFYNFFVEVFQIITQFGIVGIGLFLINGYKENLSPKIGLIAMIVYIFVIAISGILTIRMIDKYYNRFD